MSADRLVRLKRRRDKLVACERGLINWTPYKGWISSNYCTDTRTKVRRDGVSRSFNSAWRQSVSWRAPRKFNGEVVLWRVCPSRLPAMCFSSQCLENTSEELLLGHGQEERSIRRLCTSWDRQHRLQTLDFGLESAACSQRSLWPQWSDRACSWRLSRSPAYYRRNYPRQETSVLMSALKCALEDWIGCQNTPGN